MMHYRTLGKTNLNISLLSLGTGGARRFGQAQGMTQPQQNALLERAIELGINYIDTSEGYADSENILGRALAGVSRYQYILSTKWAMYKGDQLAEDPQLLIDAAERSLRRLGTEYIDIMMFHGILPHLYHDVVDRFYPAMQQLKDEGKIRFIGFSEAYGTDPAHEAIALGLKTHPHIWDVVMVKYGILNQKADDEILPLALKHQVGVLNMAAVRIKLPDPVLLEALIADWKQRGLIPTDALPAHNPLGWLVHGEVDSVISAGYKFSADHPAISTILTGTATISHLEQNARALENPALCAADTTRLKTLFGHIAEYA